jgi:hypothetical protein
MMPATVRRVFRFALFAFLLLAFGQAIRAVPVEATPETSLVLDVTVPNGPVSLGEEKTITLEVGNEASNPITHVRLHLPRHPDILYIAGPEIPAEGVTQAILDLGDLAADSSIQVQITVLVRGFTKPGNTKIPFQAMAAEADTVIDKGNLILQPPLPEQHPIPSGHSQVQAADNRIKVEFPTGWYTGTADLTLDVITQRPHIGRETPGSGGTFLEFELEAVDNGQEIESFAAPLTVTVQISDLINLENTATETLHLWTREDETTAWEELSFTLDPVAGTATFQATHFSGFGFGEGEPGAWQLTYSPPSASAYTGAANYSYPFSLPPGIGGLTPELGLHYSSRQVDGLNAPVMSRGFGIGWSMPQAEIINGNAAKFFNPDPTEQGGCPAFNKHLFTLVLNGRTYRLDPFNSVSRHGEYYATGDPSLHVEYIDQETNPPNETGEYWQVLTPDGTEYLFGINADSEQIVGPLYPDDNCIENNGQPHLWSTHSVASWKLSQVTDVYGRQIQYTYATQCGEDGGGNCRDIDPGTSGHQETEVDVAVDEIQYNFSGSTPQTVVSFDYDLHNDSAVDRDSHMTAGYYRPVTITVEHNNQVVNAYEFTYEGDSHEVTAPVSYDVGFWWIKTITPYGSDYGPGATPLPAQTFNYDHNASGCQQDKNQEANPHFVAHRLKELLAP